MQLFLLFKKRSRLVINIILLLALTFLYSGCAQFPVTQSIDKLDVNAPNGLYPIFPDIVSTGDVLEISFYQHNHLESGPYKIAVNDVLRIDINDHSELNVSRTTVLSDGTISVPLLGTVHVANHSINEISETIEKHYKKLSFRNPIATVTLVEGQQKLKWFMQSIGQDSGSNTLLLPVFGNIPVSLPFLHPVKTGRPLEDIREEIRDGYNQLFGKQLEVTVNLRSRANPKVYVMGEVKNPGSVSIDKAINPMTAIASAGGFTNQANPQQIAVIRFKGDGSNQRWLFDLQNDINQAVAEHHAFRLQNEDIVLVVRSKVANANLWIEQYIRNMLPVNVGVGIPIFVD